MKRIQSGAVVAALSALLLGALLLGALLLGALLLGAGTSRAAEFKLPSTDATPAELVNAALRSELDGPSDVRRSLLERALELDPNCAPARWQSGYVRWDDEWLTLEEVAARAAGDKRLVEYRQRRDAMIDTADEHRALAIWCKKRQLSEESRIHWAKVLEFDPADAEALAALGLQLHEGRLLTKEQIVEAKQQASQRLQAMKRWQPQMLKWRKAIALGSGKDYEAAREALRELTEIEAIGALEATFAVNASDENADALNFYLIETVGRMQTSEATLVLLRRALQADSQTVRTAACAELKKRPMHVYVPQLIAALPPKIRAKSEIYLLPNGMVIGERDYILQGPRGELSTRYVSSIFPADASAAFAVSARAAAREAHDAQVFQDIANRNIQSANQLRNRIKYAFVHAAGFTESASETDWEQQYYSYYETYYSRATATNRYANQIGFRNESYFTLPRVVDEGFEHLKPTPEQIAAQEKARADWQRRYTQFRGTPKDPRWDLIGGNSCFPANTLVLTTSGLVSIERIRVGDFVVAQDPATGELTRGIVQATTLRPAAPLVKLTLGSHSLSATRGHPFWVNGRGWTMAKHLQVGQILHGIDGAVRIDAIEALPPREAYNLVVGEFGTYFVGQQPVLVHDNSPLAETTVLVPGLDPALAP